MPAVAADPAPDARRRGLESLMAFWADAGVEAMYGDDPVDRTRRAEPTVRTRAAADPPSAVVERPPPASGFDLDLARRLAAEAMDLDTLRDAAIGYLRDALGVEARVFWRGAADAAVVVTGEAPSLDDDNARGPFAGAVGRLLDRMLAAAGLESRALAVHNRVLATAGRPSADARGTSPLRPVSGTRHRPRGAQGLAGRRGRRGEGLAGQDRADSGAPRPLAGVAFRRRRVGASGAADAKSRLPAAPAPRQEPKLERPADPVRPNASTGRTGRNRFGGSAPSPTLFGIAGYGRAGVGEGADRPEAEARTVPVARSRRRRRNRRAPPEPARP